ncbi:MAG: hypothetical protein SVV80_03995 [Planctomycetota bacterium]|nr:hypothetical protein [Planctomycetota bacterium]
MFRALTTILLFAVALSSVGIDEDPPVTSRPVSGDVAGLISPPAEVTEIYTVNRTTSRRYKPDRFDKNSGEFRFKNLPGDATYDISVVASDGRRIEGIDLSWHEARMLRLAAIRRKQLELPPEQKREFTVGDADALLKYVKDLKDFCDVRRALYIKASGLRATMLVEVMRTGEFHARRGDEIIWRMELWYFRYRYGGWERVSNVERVLERRRIPASEWKAITLVYYPGLSVYVNEKGGSMPVNFSIPRRLDGARGRLAETNPVQKTKPVIIGLPDKTRPATQPTRPASIPRQ